MTIQALTLKRGDVLHAGTCGPDFVERWRVNGAVKTWKTRPGEFRVPLKFGFYGHGEITHVNQHIFHRATECPFGHH